MAAHNKQFKIVSMKISKMSRMFFFFVSCSFWLHKEDRLEARSESYYSPTTLQCQLLFHTWPDDDVREREREKKIHFIPKRESPSLHTHKHFGRARWRRGPRRRVFSSPSSLRRRRFLVVDRCADSHTLFTLSAEQRERETPIPSHPLTHFTMYIHIEWRRSR
jgi:hypothetical protein